MGKEKSKDFGWMLGHFLIVFLTFFAAGLFVFRNHVLPPEPAVLLALLVALIHCMQDWFVWVLYRCHVKVQVVNRLSSYSSRHNVDYEIKQWKFLKDYWFFFTIGLDQYLHYILLIFVWGKFIQGG
jgi:hypothetical protein